MNNIKLSSPWITYYHKIETLFREDPDVKVQYDEDNLVLKIYVDGQDKADAIYQLLPTKVTFGNVSLAITVIPANKPTTKAEMLKKAFDGNPILSYVTKIDGIMTNPINYVVFRPTVAQFWDDNLHDPHGNVSMLYEDLAREIFGEDEGIFFSTDSLTPQAVG